MTHISQRMWHDHGPSSLRISLNTHTHARTDTSVSASLIIHQTVWGTAVGWPTMESRRRRWRSRWPSGHTCGTAAPPSCTMKWYFKKMMFQLFWFCSLSNIQITFFILPHLFFFFGASPQAVSYFTDKDYGSRTQTCTRAKSLTHTCTHVHTPEVADFPGSRVEERGGDEQTGEAAPIEPGSRAMPLVHREEVQHRPAYQTWKNPKLERKECVKLPLLVNSNICSVVGLIAFLLSVRC